MGSKAVPTHAEVAHYLECVKKANDVIRDVEHFGVFRSGEQCDSVSLVFSSGGAMG